MQRGDVADLDRREAGSADYGVEAFRRIGPVARGDDVVLGDAGAGLFDGDAGSARYHAGGRKERARPVAREQDERAVLPQEPPPLPQGCGRIVEMLDDEVRIDEVERGVLEGEAGADVAGDEAVESGVLLAGVLVEIDADQLGNRVSVTGEPRPTTAADVESAGAGAQR